MMLVLDFLASLLVLMPLIALADLYDPSSPMDISKLPHAEGGVKVIERSKMSFSPEENRESLLRLKSQKEKGYFEISSEAPRNLLRMNYSGKLQIKQNANKENDPLDTHLKSSIADVKPAFAFNGIPMLEKSTIIGYAAMGGWTDDGWTGIKMFFNNELGTCSFSQNNMKLSHGAVNISKDAARYDINKKPNTLYVEGSNNSGYLYNLNWFDDMYSKELECANMTYSEEITKKMIAYAKEIEKNNN